MPGVTGTLFSSLTLALSSPPCLRLLPQSLWPIWQELSSLYSCSIRLQWAPGPCFPPENDATDELARRGALLVPSAIPYIFSRIHSSLFLNWRPTVSSKFFHALVSSVFSEELVLPRHARWVLPRLRCNRHSLLLSSYLSRIGRIENLLCSACGHPSQDISYSYCPVADALRRSLFGDFLSLYDLWSRPWGVARLLGFHGLLHAPSLGRGRVTTTTTTLPVRSK